MSEELDDPTVPQRLPSAGPQDDDRSAGGAASDARPYLGRSTQEPEPEPAPQAQRHIEVEYAPQAAAPVELPPKAAAPALAAEQPSAPGPDSLRGYEPTNAELAAMQSGQSAPNQPMPSQLDSGPTGSGATVMRPATAAAPAEPALPAAPTSPFAAPEPASQPVPHPGADAQPSAVPQPSADTEFDPTKPTPGPPAEPRRSAPSQTDQRSFFGRLKAIFGGKSAAQAKAAEDEAAAAKAAEDERQRLAFTEARRAERLRTIDTPVDHHLITVSSLKGGVTKTTIVLALGTALARHRRDLVFAIDGNAHRGTLARRLGEETELTVRDLAARFEDIKSATDFRHYTSQATSRLEVLASEKNPAKAQGFSAEEYARVLAIVRTYRSVIMTDTGTDLTLPLMAEVYRNTDTLVVPATTALDGADLAWETLDWWEENADPALVANAVVPITQIDSFSLPASEGDITLEQLAQARQEFLEQQQRRRDELISKFSPRVGEVIFVPNDQSLHEGGLFDWDNLQPETQEAYESLAYAVARHFGTSPQRGGG